MLRLPLALALAFAQAQAPARVLQPPRTLTVIYSDGRVAPRILTPRGSSWTPKVPHRPDAPMREGLALTGLKVDHRVQSGQVVVTVSLAYGQPATHIVEVATITLEDERPVEVKELTAFGVDPITLVLEPAAPGLVVVPTTSSVSPLLGATIDLPSPDLPIYQVTFRNLSTKAIGAIAYRTYRGDTPVLSGTRSHRRSFPVLEGGGELRFTTDVARKEGPQGFDRLEVTSVLWADGTVEGDRTLKLEQQSVAIGRAQQLSRVLALLRDHKAAAVGDLQLALEKLPVNLSADEISALADPAGTRVNLAFVEAGQGYVRTAILDDLKAYLKTPGAASNMPAPTWIENTSSEYAGWLSRVKVQ